MKRNTIALLITAGLLFSACGGEKENKPDPVPENLLSVSTSNISLGSEAPITEISVNSGSDWNALIYVTDEMLNQVPDWIHLNASIDKTNGFSGSIFLSCLPNRSYSNRKATILVMSEKHKEPLEIKVEQEGIADGGQPVAWLSDDKLVQNNPFEVSGEKITVSSEVHPLYFYGWGSDNDRRFTMDFPASTDGINKVILTYRMGGGPQGCSGYDHLVYFSVKYQDEWYEIARAITPFGNSFNSSFEKKYYFDVTEYLPMLQGATECKVYFNGFDASLEGKHHTAQLTFDFYKGSSNEGKTVFVQKLYDSERDGNSGYRGFKYGYEGESIEAEPRMSPRSVSIPGDVKSLDMRVVITGHGSGMGRFPNRMSYSVRNMAEFDENFYTVKVNGTAMEPKGKIYIPCTGNYAQAGTAYYDRANWCPGNPARIERWKFKNPGLVNEIDIDFEDFILTQSTENPVAYVVQIYLFGKDK